MTHLTKGHTPRQLQLPPLAHSLIVVVPPGALSGNAKQLLCDHASSCHRMFEYADSSKGTIIGLLPGRKEQSSKCFDFCLQYFFQGNVNCKLIRNEVNNHCVCIIRSTPFFALIQLKFFKLEEESKRPPPT